MKKLLVLFGIMSALVLSAFGQASPPTPPPLALKVGDMAPDFNLPSTAGGRVKLSDFRGKNNVVLAFFVLAFTGG